MSIKLDNHRQLKSDETIRKGDFYTGGGHHHDSVAPVKHSIGETPDSYDGYKFWRRLHTKKPTVAVFTPYRKGGNSGTFVKAKTPIGSFRLQWV